MKQLLPPNSHAHIKEGQGIQHSDTSSYIHDLSQVLYDAVGRVDIDEVDGGSENI